MEKDNLSNKRIAKNAMLLYFRTGLTFIIGLYTARVVLNVLGVDDYGIYGVVGGVIGFMGFINGSMSGATSRFITYALGTGNYEKLKAVFVSAFWVHLIIATLILILAETIGLWFLFNKLSIPDGRMDAAFWVYQLSIISTLISITQVPYNACLISHENFNIYAYVEIIAAISKLLIVYLLQILPFDKLILYSILYSLVSLGTALFYRFYCTHHYDEAHVSLKYNKNIIYKMLSFSVWDLYGNFSVTAKSQGRTILINMFFGVAMNAAAAVANTVVGMLMSFTRSVEQAFRPQIVIQYAEGNIKRMETVAANSLKYSLLLMSLMMIPLLFETNFVFTLWLGIVPQNTVEFCRLIVCASFFDIATCIIINIIHATGNIKKLSFVSGTFYWLTLPVTYILFKLGFSASYAFALDIILYFLVFIINIRIAKINIPQLSQYKFYYSFFVAILSMLPAIIISAFFHSYMEEGFIRLISVIFLSCTSICIVTYFFVLDNDSRAKIKSFIIRRKNHY